METESRCVVGAGVRGERGVIINGEWGFHLEDENILEGKTKKYIFWNKIEVMVA